MIQEGSYNSNLTMKKTSQSITPKQLEILLLLYRYRFLNRIQIQQFLQHKNDTRITAWLRDLTTKEYLGRIYSHKLLENTKPAIYYLMTKSRNVLKDQEFTTKTGLSHMYREHLRSKTFQEHWVFVGDLYFYFQALAKEQGYESDFRTKADYDDHDYLLKPLPDAYIAFQAKKKKTRRYFLDVIDEGVPRFALRARIHQYVEYAQSEEWEENTSHPFPKVIFICPSESIQKYLIKHIKKILEGEDVEVMFSLTTKEQIQIKNVGQSIWNSVT